MPHGFMESVGAEPRSSELSYVEGIVRGGARKRDGVVSELGSSQLSRQVRRVGVVVPFQHLNGFVACHCTQLKDVVESGRDA